MRLPSVLILCLLSLTALANQDLEQRKKSFIEKYRLTDLVQKMNALSAQTLASPMIDELAVKKGLANEYNRLQEYLAAEKKVINLIRTIESDEQRESLSLVLGSYMSGFRYGSQEIEFYLTDQNLVNQEKYEKKTAMQKELVAKLNSDFAQTYMNNVDASLALAAADKEFLKEWTFKVIPFLPEYQWTDSAEKLHRYLWDNAMAGIFKYSSSRYTFGSYWLQSSFNNEKPGLDLNVVIRKSRPTDTLRNMNVTLRFLPFEKGDDRLEIQVCDISLSADKKSCVPQSFESWVEAVK